MKALKALTRAISQFISSRGNEYFCEIDEDYLTDRFNLTGLNTDVQYYQYALDLVTDVFDLDCDDDMREQIEKSARHLYGLVHARYITTTRGLAKMVGSIEVPAITQYRMANAQFSLRNIKNATLANVPALCAKTTLSSQPAWPTSPTSNPSNSTAANAKTSTTQNLPDTPLSMALTLAPRSKTSCSRFTQP